METFFNESLDTYDTLKVYSGDSLINLTWLMGADEQFFNRDEVSYNFIKIWRAS